MRESEPRTRVSGHGEPVDCLREDFVIVLATWRALSACCVGLSSPTFPNRRVTRLLDGPLVAESPDVVRAGDERIFAVT